MNKEQTLKATKLIVRLLLGIMLISAAVLKLLSIDNFEIYIYSFDTFNFTWTTVFSRLVIASEILLGLGLVLKIYYKQVWWLSMFMMIGFTIFLLYVIIFRNDDNCHCFGDLTKLNPSESLYKNLVSIVLLFVVKNEKDYALGKKLTKWLIGLSIALSLMIPFVVFPMDTIYNKIFSKDININTIELEKLIKDPKNVNLLYFDNANDPNIVRHDTLTMLKMSEDKYIISFIAAGCKFCNLGAKKLSKIIEHNAIDKKHLKFFVWGYDDDIVTFILETKTTDYEYWFIDPEKSIDITYGRFPIFVWVDNRNIICSDDLRDLDEFKITKFLN